MKPVIMIVDDDYAITHLLSIMLKNHGYTTITAPDGSVALETLKVCPLPALIITDYCMPILNGNELIENLSSQSMFKNVPIVIMTGSQIDDITLPNTPNFKGIIKKPFNMEIILNVLHTIGNIGTEHQGVSENLLA